MKVNYSRTSASVFSARSIMFFVILLICKQSLLVAAATGVDADSSERGRAQEQLLWAAFNECDTRKLRQLLDPGLEFYHDIDGLIVGADAFTETLKLNLCGDGQPSLRREAVDNTDSVHRISDYGLLIVGKHRFYSGQVAQSVAKYAHLWRLHDGDLKLSRVFSYDHQTGATQAKALPISLSAETLSLYAGRYHSAETGAIVITVVDNYLLIKAADFEMPLLPVGDDVFDAEHAPLQFRFIRTTAGDMEKFMIYELGELVEEVMRAEQH